MSVRSRAIEDLYGTRPTRPVVTGSIWVMAVGLVSVWLVCDVSLMDLLRPRRLGNLARFFGDVAPPDGVGFVSWVGDVLGGRWSAAVVPTIALAVFSTVLAGGLGLVFSLLSSRRLMHSEPWLHSGRPPRRPEVLGWAAAGQLFRFLLMVMRAVPTYLWAYILVLLCGLGVWPAVLALVLHNTGILGRLGAELVDDLEPGASGALRGMGAGRRQIALISVGPDAFGRGLMYFFVRWETAVREATVLGLLGFVSLGWFIQDARVRMRLDEMMLFVGLGVVIVVVGDVLSVRLRRLVRKV
jgi:phosphonate transport system permease protein